jgi:DNA-binding transcriptional MerR regulator
MLTIGAFSRLAGVSVRALRHYETVGILMPAWTDPTTGYRHYRASQFARLHRIQALQDLGLSLRQVRPLLDDGLTVEQLSGMLALKQAELAERVADDTARLARVERRLRYIEMEDDMSLDFVIKQIPPVRVAQLRYSDPAGLTFSSIGDFLWRAWKDIQEALAAEGVEGMAPGFAHYEERPDETLIPAVAVPISNGATITAPQIEVVELPAITAVVTVYRGPASHDIIGPIYTQMVRFAEDHGYAYQGPGRDHFVSRDDDSEGIVLELQLPVTPSNAA